MHKKLFIKTAEILKGIIDKNSKRKAVFQFVEVFKAENKLFNCKIFLSACGCVDLIKDVGKVEAKLKVENIDSQDKKKAESCLSGCVASVFCIKIYNTFIYKG